MPLIVQMKADTEREARFRQCLERHRGIVWKVVRSFHPSAADEGVLYQAILLAIWQALPRYRGTASLSTWTYGVALRTALHWRRQETKGRQRHAPLPENAEWADLAAERDLRIEALYAAIRQLPEVDRSVVLMQLDGCSYREIAEATGLSESNVGVRLTRMRKELYNRIKEIENEH